MSDIVSISPEGCPNRFSAPQDEAETPLAYADAERSTHVLSAPDSISPLLETMPMFSFASPPSSTFSSAATIASTPSQTSSGFFRAKQKIRNKKVVPSVLPSPCAFSGRIDLTKRSDATILSKSTTSLGLESEVEPAILEKHKSFGLRLESSTEHSQEASLRKLAFQVASENKCVEHGRPSRPSISRLIIGVWSKQKELREDDLIIDDSNAHLKIIDPYRRLGLSNLPPLFGYLYMKRHGRLPFFTWTRRYVVLQEGMLYWFPSRAAFINIGLSAAVGSLSLILQKSLVDIVVTNGLQFTVMTAGMKEPILFDCSKSEHDRGVWVVHFLAHINKSEEIRGRFTSVDWTALEIAAIKRMSLRCQLKKSQSSLSLRKWSTPTVRSCHSNIVFMNHEMR